MTSHPDPQAVVFDRAADYYDRTRALSDSAMSLLVERLQQEIGGAACLEIGVGTGRYALPLQSAGVSMAGIDLSIPMLERLRVNAGPEGPPPFACADATRLPFPDDSFGASLAVHVFHLIPAWRSALAEMSRVVAPGGKLLIDLGGWGTGTWKEVEDVYCEAAGIDMMHPGTNDHEEVDEAAAELGARVRAMEAVHESKPYRFDEAIDMLERGIFSFTWRVDEAHRRKGADAVRAWLDRSGYDPTGTFSSERDIVVRVYELP